MKYSEALCGEPGGSVSRYKSQHLLCAVQPDLGPVRSNGKGLLAVGMVSELKVGISK